MPALYSNVSTEQELGVQNLPTEVTLPGMTATAAHAGPVQSADPHIFCCSCCCADANKDHKALLARFEAVNAELARYKAAAADMRLRLEHFTGPAGPQARMKQLEASLQSVSDLHLVLCVEWLA